MLDQPKWSGDRMRRSRLAYVLHTARKSATCVSGDLQVDHRTGTGDPVPTSDAELMGDLASFQ
jgi:hypothetical protein